MDGPGIGSRRSQGGKVRVYFCCCPFTLLLAPALLLGRPAVTPWSALAVGGASGNAEDGR